MPTHIPKNSLSDLTFSREYAADLGNPRRSQRARKVGVALALKPELSFPKVFPDEAGLEAAYRLLRNPEVDWRALAAPHAERTLERAEAAGEVVVAHDTTAIALRMYWPDERRRHMSSFSSRTQGFFAHVSLAMTADGRALPLGVLGVQPFVHQSGLDANDSDSWAFWENEGGLYDNEHERWASAVAGTDDRLRERGVRAIHVMDGEADSYGLMSFFKEQDFRFVIRADPSRKLKCDGGLTDVGTVKVPLGERFPLRDGKESKRNPPRRAREAELTIRAGVVTLARAQKKADASWSPGGVEAQPKTLTLHLVEAVEKTPPAGQTGVRWLLLTTEPVKTQAEVLRVIDLYRRRWLIEEYFKSLKTGCRVEDRQMESMTTMLNVLALLIPAAWRLLVLRTLAHEAPATSWKNLLTPLEFKLLAGRVKRDKLGAPLGPNATVAQCLAAIAKLGGHLKRNGPPGWQTLHAGWRSLQEMALGVRIFREASDQ